MRSPSVFLALLFAGIAAPVVAQYPAQPYGQPLPPPAADQGILYNSKKPVPAVIVVEPGNAGIPTSGVMPLPQQTAPRSANRGPTVMYHDRKDKGLTVITGPDGTTICRDISGRTVVCY